MFLLTASFKIMRNIEIPALIIVVLLTLVALTLLLLLFGQEKEAFVAPVFAGKIHLGGAASCDAVAYNSEFNLIFAADSVLGRIYIFRPDGRLVTEFKKREYGKTGFLAVRDLLSYENGVLVSDPAERQVFFLKPGKEPVEVLDDEFPVKFDPGTLARGPGQSFFLVDEGCSCVYRISPQGKILERQGFPGHFDQIPAVAFKNGRLILLSGKNAEMVFMDKKNFKKVKLKGRTGSYYPFDLLVLGDFSYVADPFYQEVIVFDSSGREKGSFGRSVVAARQLDLPVSMDYGDGYIFVAEKKERCISVWKLKP